MSIDRKRFIVTGSAGFIGYHVCELLLKQGCTVLGFDGITDYYSTQLKRARHERLRAYEDFSAVEAMLEDDHAVRQSFEKFRPDVVIHLAAQAGVRYSLENPRAYIDSNIVGTFNVMDACKEYDVDHFLLASTSSVYGANEEMPFVETDKADHQLTTYAATKKATESLSHAYAHIHGTPTTVFRFFTVYGPWGRPDMALFKFADAILKDEPIDVYNNGDMYRDFTYVDDIALAIVGLVEQKPTSNELPESEYYSDSLSPVAPWRIVNIGNSEKVRLLDFIEALEKTLDKKAIRNYMPIQTGDVPATWADTGLLKALTGFQPSTSFEGGIERFCAWFLEYRQS